MSGSIEGSAAWDLAPLEWAEVLERLAAHTQTPMGEERARRLSPAWTDADGADHPRVRQQRTREAGAMETAAAAPVLKGAGPAGDLAERAERGGVLRASECWTVALTVARAQAAQEAVAAHADAPALAALCAAWRPPLELRAALEWAVSEDGSVRDRASEPLAALRRRQRELASEIDAIFERILRSPGWLAYLQEPVVAIRLGRRVLPVRHEFRAKVAGIVHDQSGSGQTVFVEPIEVVERQSRLARLAEEEAEEIERILTALSQQVAAHRAALADLQQGLAELDVTFAMARLGRAWEAVLPELGGEVLALQDARHPLLEQPVPFSLEVSDRQPVLMISGPNTGGKTVTLKTTGLVAAMALCGMPVPAAAATVPLYRALWVDIGDRQSLAQNLSTFTAHLSRLLPILQFQPEPERDRRALALIDEIGAGTDPEEGAALAQAIVERLAERRLHSLITTHLGRLKLLAYQDGRISNAQVEFDRERLVPTYRLRLGQPGSSYALHIAERMGVDPPLIARARALLGESQRALEAALAGLDRLNRTLEAERADVTRLKAELEAARARQTEAEQAFREWSEREKERLRREWEQHLARVTQEAETLLAQARAADREEQRQAAEALRRRLREARILPSPAPAPRRAPLREGDRVLVAGFSEPGQIRELAGRGEMATVDVGGIRLRVPVAELAPAPAAAAGSRQAPARSGAGMGLGKALTARPELDVRGERVDDALYALDKFLDDAVLMQWPEVRIVHGKGTGALRRAVQEFLRADPRVAQFRLGERGEGGDGVSVATLKAGG